jgi:hypothetical protein
MCNIRRHIHLCPTLILHFSYPWLLDSYLLYCQQCIVTAGCVTPIVRLLNFGSQVSSRGPYILDISSFSSITLGKCRHGAQKWATIYSLHVLAKLLTPFRN